MGVGSISPHELKSAIRHMGYGVGAPRAGRQLAFVICKRTGKPRRLDGERRYENIGRALTIEEETMLCSTSKNAMDAARRAEALVLGKPDPGSGKVSQDVDLDLLVSQGVEQKLASLGLTADVLRHLTQAAAANPAPAAPVKRRGRPKGSKNKPKQVAAAPEAPAAE